jgi:sterol desaturase/sphingolipid hydroxylase (fatty acid hydroxylase superfamily)
MTRKAPAKAWEAGVEGLGNIASGTFLALFLLVTAIAMEHLGPLERYSLRDRVPGFLMNTVGTFFSIALVWPLNWLWLKLGLAPAFIVPLWRWLEPLGATGYAIQIVVLVAVADFLAYWRHRAEHAWFWRIHVVHHSPRELHAANDIGHPVQGLFSFAFITIPMSLIQIDGPGAPFAVGAIVGLASLYIHSPVEWHFGPLRKLLVDNRFHRIHHSLEPRHFNKNFGICFSLWDRMFGTAYEPGEEWPAVGVDGVAAPRTVKAFLKLPLGAGEEEQPSSRVKPASRTLVGPDALQ